jgi:hypothetical protein
MVVASSTCRVATLSVAAKIAPIARASFERGGRLMNRHGKVHSGGVTKQSHKPLPQICA